MEDGIMQEISRLNKRICVNEDLCEQNRTQANQAARFSHFSDHRVFNIVSWRMFWTPSSQSFGRVLQARKPIATMLDVIHAPKKF